MVQIPIDQMVRILFKEAVARKGIITLLFTLITLSLLITGLFWPKTYQSSTSIIADDKKIIRPLMQGNAVTTSISDQIRIAKELIFSRAIMDQIIELGGWSPLSPIEQERQIKTIRDNTSIGRGGGNLIKIAYRDSDPQRAFLVTQKLAELFISESERTKQKESSDAYDFIDKQVTIYHEKLIAAEKRLKVLREENIDARPGSAAEVNRHIDGLRNEIRDTQVRLKEAQIRQASLEKQLSGEAKVAKNIAKINYYRQRISEMEITLDSMRLSYHETYPDIIQLKNQIKELQISLEREEKIAKEAGTLADSHVNQALPVNTPNSDRATTGSVNPVYVELRSYLANTITQIATYHARIKEIEQFLQVELDRLQRISDGEALLAELTRDYEVHQTIYQDLLERREKARVSLHLQLENQGLNFKIQEPANLPLTPSGMRFLYFAIIAPFVGMAFPLACLYVLILLDGKIRYEKMLTEEFGLPLLGHIPHATSPTEARAKRASNRVCLLLLLLVLVAYGVAGWIKYIELL